MMLKKNQVATEVMFVNKPQHCAAKKGVTSAPDATKPGQMTGLRR
jgi:hypothetical protein